MVRASAARHMLRPIRAADPQLDFALILSALPDPVLVVDDRMVVRYVNEGALNFFHAPESSLVDKEIGDFLPPDSPVVLLVRQVLDTGSTISESGVLIETPRVDAQQVTLTIGPMGDGPTHAVITLHSVSLAKRIDRQLSRRNATKSVSAMASMLAHEVKNPLSGIRGAAQLLEQTIGEEDQRLTTLICRESDRIVRLVNRMEVLADGAIVDRHGVNIHSALEQVRSAAQSGFGQHVKFIEHYDPSLPAVLGNRDQLIQLFLNLVKNACEAAPTDGGEVVLTTSFQRGVSVVAPGARRATLLPLRVTVQDNGAGIPEELRDHLFDPFITTKKSGSGLGLALVAKVVGDHGGVIEVNSDTGHTTFQVSLPIVSDTEQSANA